MLLNWLKGELNMDYKELEIKILNINREEVIDRLNKIGA